MKTIDEVNEFIWDYLRLNPENHPALVDALKRIVELAEKQDRPPYSDDQYIQDLQDALRDLRSQTDERYRDALQQLARANVLITVLTDRILASETPELMFE